MVFAVTRTERDTYSRSVCGMNESSLKLNFRPETLVPSQPHRPGDYPALWWVLSFLKSMHSVESIGGICLCRGWVRSLFLCQEVGILLGDNITFPLESKQYVLHYLMLLRHLSCELWIPGELCTSVSTGGPKCEIVECTRWSPSCSMLTWLTSPPTWLPSFELWDCWEPLR